MNFIAEYFPSVLSWFTSAALVAFIVFLFNERKEYKRLRVCCRVLLVEIERHKSLLVALLERNPAVLDLLLDSDFISKDWDKLKHESVFARIPFKDFELILLHYKELTGLQVVIKKSMEQGILFIADKEMLMRRLEAYEKAYNVLKKLAKPTTDAKGNKDK